ncbi:tetratricopeptide repeat-containing sensor histidine kinase [Flavobacterium sp. JP2137]|uniref:tetratricopeptide repeat-containing sensor histidine kinase n=1 Tax=Flavobacterium sp. JP2137 TaxID=3414510 RepID=UPI003D2FDF78
MKLFLIVLFYFSVLASYAQHGQEINTEWMKVCQPDNQEEYFNCLNDLYRKYPADSTYLHVLFEKAIYYNDIGQADSVVKLALFGVEEAKNSRSSKAETMQAAFLNLLAAKYQMQGRFSEAMTLMMESLRLHEKNNNIKYSSILNFNIGAYHASLKDFDSAKKYFEQSFERFKKMQDTTYMSASLIALSECHMHLGEELESRQTGELAYQYAEISNYLTAKISYFWISGSLYEKQKHYDQAVAQFNMGESLMDTTGLYTNYYMVHFIVGKMKIYNKLKKYPHALEEAKKLDEIIKDPSITIILPDYHQALAASHFGIGSNRLAYLHLQTAYTLQEKNLSKENKDIVNKWTLEYQAEKKDKEIAESKLKVAQQSSEIAKRNLIVTSLILIVLILIVLFLYLKSRNKFRFNQLRETNKRRLVEAELSGELKEQHRLSVELHDGIASNLIAIKLQIENHPFSHDFSRTIDLVSDTHQEVQKVARNLMPIDFDQQNLVTALHAFSRQCDSRETLVNFESNCNAIMLNKEKSLVLYRIAQEFIQNALKHAQANRIDVLFLQNDSGITLNIEDDGIGFNLKDSSDLKGYHHIIERLHKIQAKISLDSSLGSGTSVFISLKID